MVHDVALDNEPADAGVDVRAAVSLTVLGRLMSSCMTSYMLFRVSYMLFWK